MTDTITPKQDLVSIEQKLMVALVFGENSSDYRYHAAAIIKNHSAKELFTPDKEIPNNKNVLHYAIETNDTINALALINKEGVTAEQLFHQDSVLLFSPLHDAIYMKNEAVATALINKEGVTAKHLSLKNNAGETALDMAKEKKMGKVINAINKKLLTEAIQTTAPTHQAEQQLQH
jgi:hypothetical protein